MPRGRMINKQISTSEKVSELPVEGQLLYTWLIPHSDVEGRLNGDKYSIKALVPFVDEITPENIPQLLSKMQSVGLIEYYGNKHKYVQINDFDSYQKLRKDQEAPTVMPSPDEFHSNNGVTTEQKRSRNCIKVKDKLKDKDIYSEKPTKNPLVPLVETYYELVGITNKAQKNAGYSRCAKTAKEILDFCEGDSDLAVKTIRKAPKYFDEMGVNWKFETVANHWHKIVGVKTKPRKGEML